MAQLLIGAYTPDKGSGTGIAVIDDGDVASIVPAESPAWLARHPSLPVLYAVSETETGGVAAWALTDGVPSMLLGTGESGGADPCHLTVERTGRFLVTANYTGGSVAVHALAGDGRIGARTDLVAHERHGSHPRQGSPHPHMVRQAGPSLLVSDLGGDAVYRYRLDDDGKLHRATIIDVPAGSGPRHMLPVGDRWYVTAELSGRLLVFDGGWEPLGEVPLSRSPQLSQASEVAAGADGRFLYVGNRGPNTVTVFALDGDLPRYVAEVPTGDWPRHLLVDGGNLYVANERSNEVMIMGIDPATGVPGLTGTIRTPSPTCVLR